MSVRLRILLLAVLVGLTVAVPGWAITANTRPSRAELRSLLRLLPGQKLCFPQNARISGTDRRYAVVVTQAACGATLYNHTWLKRRSPSRPGPWSIVGRRSGTIDRPARCVKAHEVPADIRCL